MVLNKIFHTILLSFVFLISTVEAHCPLCTIGAGAAAAGAVWLGVSKVIVGLFIGAFAMSLGLWFSRIVKNKYVPLQKTLITITVFLLTVLPLLPVFGAIGPLYVPFIGEYGKTYAINYSLFSSFFGGIIVFISPLLNKKIKEFRGEKGIPFQGILLTFFLLIIVALIIQFII